MFSTTDTTFTDKGFKGEYIKNPQKPTISAHNGQMKLMLMESLFISNYIMPKMKEMKRTDAVLVYAGAAPGNHFPFLLRMYPFLTVELYDPAPFAILKYQKEFADRLRIYRRPMTLTTCMNSKERNKNKLLFFFSDVRVPYANMVEDMEMDNDLSTMRDMKRQMEWHNALNPIMSMLKFHLPYNDNRMLYDWIEYFDGILLLQPYQREGGTECRLVVEQGAKMKYYNSDDYENIFVYHNQIERQNKIYTLETFTKNVRDGLRKKNYINSDYLFGREFDNAYTIYIINQYLDAVGYPIDSGRMNTINSIVNSMIQSLTNPDMDTTFDLFKLNVDPSRTLPKFEGKNVLEDAIDNYFGFQELRINFYKICFDMFGFIPSNNSFTRYILQAIKPDMKLDKSYKANEEDKIYESIARNIKMPKSYNDSFIGEIGEIINKYFDLAKKFKPINKTVSDIEIIRQYAKLLILQIDKLKLSSDKETLNKIIDNDYEIDIAWELLYEAVNRDQKIEVKQLQKFYDAVYDSFKIENKGAIIIRKDSNDKRFEEIIIIPVKGSKVDLMTIEQFTKKISRERFYESIYKSLNNDSNNPDKEQKIRPKYVYQLLAKKYEIHKVYNPYKNYLLSLNNNTNLFYATIINYIALWSPLYDRKYVSTDSAGFRRALTDKTFVALSEYYNINLELFASPLDNTLSNYASLLDIDKYYGSMGTAQEAIKYALKEFKEVNIQANPAYTYDQMKMFRDMAIDALGVNNKPVTIILFIPDINDIAGKLILDEDKLQKYITVSYTVPASQAIYIVGDQEVHLGSVTEYETDVKIILLQNERSKKKYSIDGLKIVSDAMTV